MERVTKTSKELKKQGYVSATTAHNMIFLFAKELGDSKSNLYEMLPQDVPFVKTGIGKGTRRYYLKSDVEEWLDGLSQVEEKPW